MKKNAQTPDDQKLRKKTRQDASNRDAKAALSDDDLGLVSAAGETTVPTMEPEVLLGRHARPDNPKDNRP